MNATKTIAFATLAAVVAIGCSTGTTAKQPDAVADAGITAKVKTKLAADPGVNPFEIDVDTSAGVVRLSGYVETETERSEAGRLAAAVKGVDTVENEIRIGDLTAKENITDKWILTKVKAKLTADPGVNPFPIDVDVSLGVVTLSGEVARDDQRKEAEKLAGSTKGVSSVRNLLTVKKSAS